ncbi:hypothetical protein LWI29_024964 [Acer saccharum]|uniref:Uncharacterized protein n=1 Tax=Acer saccharum TaxID=4024 RepID=A0AA39UKM8_ACESA|nr:hypothetical protein LWI29_024964 [Acer saccharum]
MKSTQQSVFPYKSLNITLSRPNTTTIASWIPPVLTVTVPSPYQLVTFAAVPSPKLPPCADSFVFPQADRIQVSLLPTITTPAPSSIVITAPSSEAAATATVDTSNTSGILSSSNTVIAPTDIVVAPTDTVVAPLLASSQQPTHATSPLESQNEHSMTTKAKNNIHKPIQKLNLHTQLNSLTDFEPTTMSQALKDPNWRKAMSEECNALVKNGTWELV